LQADRIIHEQQLGIPWNPPSVDLFRNIDPLVVREAQRKTIGDVETEYEQEMNGKANLSNNIDGEQKDSLATRFHGMRNHSKTMKKTLELLCNEAGFLVEDKLQKLLEPLHRDEQSLMRLDSIFKAVGVETIEEIERLTSYFVANKPRNAEDDRYGSVELINEDKAVLIHPDEVVTAIKNFIEDNRRIMSADVAQEKLNQQEAIPDNITNGSFLLT
jgi:dynein regulatory complex protein 1